MARRGILEPSFALIVVMLFLSLMFQEIAATSRSLCSKQEGCNANTKCNNKATTPETEYYAQEGDHQAPPMQTDNYDYDFYRKHGDIPSPGAGH